MRAEGVIPANSGDIVANTFCRFDIEGERRGKKSGFCLFHDDEFPNGIFGDLRHHDKSNPLKWTPKVNPGRELTADELRERKAAIAKQREQRRLEIAKLQAEAAETCRKIWESAPKAEESHPYLVAKRIKPHNARLSRDNLIIPIVKDGRITSLQFILPAKNEDGKNKFFKKGGEIQGCYSVIGGKPDRELIVCEGWATGASIHEATGTPVIVAFDAGNLEAVAQAMRTKFPEAKIIIAADDDRWTSEPVQNPGVHYAGKAAALVKGEMRRPIFKPGFEGRPTDFNDLAVMYGIDEVRAQITTGKPTFEENALTVGFNEFVLLAPFPHMTMSKPPKPMATIENVRELLDRVGIIVRYNVISKDEEILVPDSTYSIDNQKNASFAKILSYCNIAKIPLSNIESFITEISDRNQYNPVITWVTSKPWDRRSRLQEFYETVRTQDETVELRNILLKRWLISAIAAAFEPRGISAHGVLVFQGDQGLGKTSWFKRLAPADLNVLSDGKTLRIDDKDSIFQVLSHWIVELGELDSTFKKSDIAQLKSFLTKESDVLRRPFARKESYYARRTIFFGSVNQPDFLADTTGNRRYWIIPCTSLDYKHNVDMQQLWAEVFETLYAQGEPWILQDDEKALCDANNENFELIDPIAEKIMTKYDWDTKHGWRWLTATEIVEELGFIRPTKNELSSATRIMKKMNGNQFYKSGSKKLLSVPPFRLQIPHSGFPIR